MKRPRAFLAVVSAGLLAITMPVHAENSYLISLDLDQSANGELSVVKAVLGTADGGEASPALRGIAARLTTEFQVSLSDRINDDDMLKLDDGSEVLLLEGDELKILPKNCKSFPCAGATIVWGKGHGRPAAIFITNAFGECVKSIRWNVLKGTRRPHVSDTCDVKQEIPPPTKG